MYAISSDRSTSINRSHTVPINTPRNSQQFILFSGAENKVQERASIGFFGRQEINFHTDSTLNQVHSILKKNERGQITHAQQRILYTGFCNIYDTLKTHPHKEKVPGSIIADAYSHALQYMNSETHYSSDIFKISCDIVSLIMDDFLIKIENNYNKNKIPQKLETFSMKLIPEYSNSLILKDSRSMHNTPIKKIFLKIISFHMKMSAMNVASLRQNLNASLSQYQSFLMQFSPVLNPITGTATALTALTDDIAKLIQDILDTAVLFTNDFINIGNDLMNLQGNILSGFISLLLKLFNPFGITLENRNHRTGLPILPRFHSPFHFYSHLLPHLYPHFQGDEHLLIAQLDPHLSQTHIGDEEFENLINLQLSLFQKGSKTTHKVVGKKLFQEMDDFQNFYALLKGATEFGFVYDADKIESLVKKTFHHMSIGMTEAQFTTAQNFIALLANENSMQNPINFDIIHTMYFLSMAVLTEETGAFSPKKLLSRKVRFSIFVLKILLQSQHPAVTRTLTEEKRNAVYAISMKHHIAELSETFV